MQAVAPAAAFAADVREELERQPAAVVLTELLLWGPQVAAEAAGVPYVVLNPTINVIPAPGVPPFGLGLMPATSAEERRRDEEVAAIVMAGWDEALPALNRARAEQGLEPLEHVLDQRRSAALVLVMTSRAFDFIAPLPPVVKHVGPRLDDIAWAACVPLVCMPMGRDQHDVAARVVHAGAGVRLEASAAPVGCTRAVIGRARAEHCHRRRLYLVLEGA